MKKCKKSLKAATFRSRTRNAHRAEQLGLGPATSIYWWHKVFNCARRRMKGQYDLYARQHGKMLHFSSGAVIAAKHQSVLVLDSSLFAHCMLRTRRDCSIQSHYRWLAQILDHLPNLFLSKPLFIALALIQLVPSSQGLKRFTPLTAKVFVQLQIAYSPPPFLRGREYEMEL